MSWTKDAINGISLSLGGELRGTANAKSSVVINGNICNVPIPRCTERKRKANEVSSLRVIMCSYLIAIICMPRMSKGNQSG